MRIRKRQLPFSLSSSLPSDPQLNRSPVVQLPPLNNPHGNPLPSDRPNPPIGDSTTASDSSNKKDRDCLELKQGKPAAAAVVEEAEEEERGELERRSNDTRKKSILGAEVGTGSGSGSGSVSSHHQVVERWYEEEKVFPLKKRRGSFERRVEDEMIMEKDKKGNTKMKTKMNKKCGQQKDNEQEENKEADSSTTTAGAKKKGRGGALMEGSRCSRVNGRGWRCCQQTLVGYSLCEHHLGKGRLRSMTSVRSRSLSTSSTTSAPAKKDDPEPSPSSLSLQDNKKVILLDDDNENGNTVEEEKKTKKKTKLGMVKARSISSLLGQTNNDGFACVVDENK
ncbi:hypothetical protein SLE2022_063500 [Rubroshorea leprosula]